MKRRVIVTSLLLAVVGAGAVPALASAPSTLPGPPLHDRYICIAGSENPKQGFCIWAPLPVRSGT